MKNLAISEIPEYLQQQIKKQEILLKTIQSHASDAKDEKRGELVKETIEAIVTKRVEVIIQDEVTGEERTEIVERQEVEEVERKKISMERLMFGEPTGVSDVVDASDASFELALHDIDQVEKTISVFEEQYLNSIAELEKALECVNNARKSIDAYRQLVAETQKAAATL